MILFTLFLAWVGSIFHAERWPQSWFGIWNHWDTNHYLTIVEKGYFEASHADASEICFFPLFPWLVRALSWISGDALLSGLFISNLCFLIALVFLYRLARMELSRSGAFRGVVLFALFPTAYFLHAAYTESLFLVLATGAFYFARCRKWALAAALGALSSGTRMVGLALIPALALEIWCARGLSLKSLSIRRLLVPELAWLALIPAGTLVYLAINFQVFGNPLEFIDAQRAHFSRSFAWPTQGLMTALDFIPRAPKASKALTAGGLESFFLILSFFAALWSLVRQRASYGVYMLTVWMMCASTGVLLSMPRHTITLFPLFFALAEWTRARWLMGALAFLFAGFQVLLLQRFVTGRWAF